MGRGLLHSSPVRPSLVFSICLAISKQLKELVIVPVHKHWTVDGCQNLTLSRTASACSSAWGSSSIFRSPYWTSLLRIAMKTRIFRTRPMFSWTNISMPIALFFCKMLHCGDRIYLSPHSVTLHFHSHTHKTVIATFCWMCLFLPHSRCFRWFHSSNEQVLYLFVVHHHKFCI